MIAPIFRLGWPHRPTGPALLRIGGILLGVTLVGACQSATARRTLPHLQTAYSAAPATGGVALVLLPNGGPVASVQETRSSAGLRQRIILGQSRGRIDLTVASGRIWDDPAMEKPSRIGIAAELATLENGRSYRIVRRPMGNAYGPLGVAVNERCAYAWQWIDSLSRIDQLRFAVRGPVSLSLRVHHCHAQPTAAEALLADLERIRFGAVANTFPGSRPRVARPKPETNAPAQVAEPVASPPARASAPSPTVAVNGSRTLVMLPQGAAAQPAPAATEPTIPTVPRPATAGAATEQSRFLTDALPPSSRASVPNPQSAPLESPTRTLTGSRPPAGW